MQKRKIYLPYKAKTTTNKILDFNFRLDENTNSPLAIHEMINLLLSKISSEIQIMKPSNGDIIQAICMVLVIRSRMIDYDINKLEMIVKNTLENAFKDAKNSKVIEPNHGNT